MIHVDKKEQKSTCCFANRQICISGVADVRAAWIQGFSSVPLVQQYKSQFPLLIKYFKLNLEIPKPGALVLAALFSIFNHSLIL